MNKERKIIGNDVIALFVCYNQYHLDWIKTYKNAIFLNKPEFYEEYLQCFSENNYTKENLKIIIRKIEKYYNTKFYFDENFLDYPNFKKEGHYSDLSFNVNNSYYDYMNQINYF